MPVTNCLNRNTGEETNLDISNREKDKTSLYAADVSVGEVMSYYQERVIFLWNVESKDLQIVELEKKLQN